MDEDRNFWTSTMTRRISRRTAMRGLGLGGAGLAGAVLIGCGDDDDDEAAAPAAAQATAAPTKAAPTKAAPTEAAGEQPKVGGHLTIPASTPPPHFDISVSTAGGALGAIGGVYSKIWKYIARGDDSVWLAKQEPDLAETLEQPDDTTYIFDTRRGAKWQDVAPVNGRDFTAEDVVYAYEHTRGQEESNVRPELSQLDTIRAIDDHTLEMVTKEASATFTAKVGGQNLWVYPREIIERDGNLQKAAIGTGPYIMDKVTANVGIEYHRNPDYYASPIPYIERLSRIQIADKAAQESAFITGKIAELGGLDERARDRVLKSVSDAHVRSVLRPGNYLYFRCDRPPFDDIRARQAVLLTIDYAGLIEAFTQGEGEISTVVPQPYLPWSLPHKEWGAGAKFHSERDLPEATKLLEAAGYSGDFEFDFYTASPFVNFYSLGPTMDVMAAGLREVGATMHQKLEEYAVYSPRIAGVSEYSGILQIPQAIYNDPDEYYYSFLYPGTRRFASYHDDPTMEAWILKQRATLDADARQELLWNVERRDLEKNYFVGVIHMPQYSLTHPWYKSNYQRGDFGWDEEAWMDKA